MKIAMPGVRSIDYRVVVYAAAVGTAVATDPSVSPFALVSAEKKQIENKHYTR